MNRKLQLALAHFIAFIPTRALRRFAYGLMPGYTLARDVTIGLGTVIAVDRFVAGSRVSIRRGNRFVGPIDVQLGERTTMLAPVWAAALAPDREAS